MAGTDGRPQGGARGWCGRSSVVAPPQPYLWLLGPSRHRSGYRYRVCDKSMHWQDNAAHNNACLHCTCSWISEWEGKTNSLLQSFSFIQLYN